MRALTSYAILLAVVAGVGSFAWPTSSPSQESGPKTVGILCHCAESSPFLRAFEAGLDETGWKSHDTVRIIRRTSNGDPARLDAQADEVLAAKPAVMFAGFTPAATALQAKTSDVAIVFAGVSDPIEIGATHEIHRPDRNLTGLTTINRELMPKRLELLHEAPPDLKIVGYLASPRYALHALQLRELTEAADGLGLTLVTVEATDPPGIDLAFARFVAEKAGAFIVQQDPLFTGQPQRILALAEANRLPGMYPLKSYIDAGGLMWYGRNVTSQFREAASYVDRILKGARPSQLPIERPSKLVLGFNLRLANKMGLTMAPSFIARVDELMD